MEALLGAIYLEAGFDTAQEVMRRLFAPLLESLDADVVRKDAKTQLQEFLQGQRLPLPSYAVLDVRGAAHQQQFKVECAVAALGLKVEGEGDSRRRAANYGYFPSTSLIVVRRLGVDIDDVKLIGLGFPQGVDDHFAGHICKKTREADGPNVPVKMEFLHDRLPKGRV